MLKTIVLELAHDGVVGLCFRSKVSAMRVKSKGGFVARPAWSSLGHMAGSRHLCLSPSGPARNYNNGTPFASGRHGLVFSTLGMDRRVRHVDMHGSIWGSSGPKARKCSKRAFCDSFWPLLGPRPANAQNEASEAHAGHFWAEGPWPKDGQSHPLYLYWLAFNTERRKMKAHERPGDVKPWPGPALSTRIGTTSAPKARKG